MGNKCGHDKLSPQIFKRPCAHKNAPLAISVAMSNVNAYYDDPDAFLQNLLYARDSVRQQRSESREAIGSLASVLLNHCELETMRVVKFHPNKPRLLSVKELAALAGIGYKRCQRALKCLKEAGYLTLQYRCKSTVSGEIKPLVAIKRLNAKLFYDLGVKGELLRGCKNYIYKQIKKATKRGKKACVQIKQMLSQTHLRRETMQISSESTFASKKRYADRLYELRLKYPTWTSAQLRAAI